MIKLCRELRAKYKFVSKINYSFMFVSHVGSVWHAVQSLFNARSFNVLLLQTETWHILPVSALVTSKSTSKTTVSLYQVQPPKYGDVWLCFCRVPATFHEVREKFVFAVLFFEGPVLTRLSNESLAEFL